MARLADRSPPAQARRSAAGRAAAPSACSTSAPTKIVCVIGRIEYDGEPRVLGFGWQRARGVRGGGIVDIEEAERAIRAAVGRPRRWPTSS